MTNRHKATQSRRDAEHLDKDPLWLNNARTHGHECIRALSQGIRAGPWPPATTSRTNILLFRQLVSV